MNKTLKCSFCGLEKDESEIKEGIDGNICFDCLELEKPNIKQMGTFKLLKAHEIKQELDKYVIAQEKTKKTLSVEVYNHYKRISFKKKSIDFPKTNILMIGPSGSGKTYLLECLSRILNVPFIIGDATAYTEAGYVGKDVDSLLSELVEKSNGDINLAEKGIIYIDEIDKICNSDKGNVSKDVGGQGVQNALLKMLDGEEYIFPKTGETINTKNILFICGGAFEGLDKIILERLKGKSTIGFYNNNKSNNIEQQNLLSFVTEEDILKYGFIKEFLGRLPLTTTLEKLSKEDLKSILVKPKNAIIKQYTALFKVDDIKLKFSKDALDYIAHKAYEKGTGARALNGIISDKLNELMYDLPQQEEIKEYVVTKEFLENKENKYMI